MRELENSARGALLCNSPRRRGPQSASKVLQQYYNSAPKVFQKCPKSDTTVIQHYSKCDKHVIYK
eukprot:9865276-Heterocapsa_arctica.AAC.1